MLALWITDLMFAGALILGWAVMASSPLGQLHEPYVTLKMVQRNIF
jgi:hypothetical protein